MSDLCKGMLETYHLWMWGPTACLSAALQAPSLQSTMRVKLTLDGFEESVIRSMLPHLTCIRHGGNNHHVAHSHAAFQKACFFPFHANGFREGKLFKPRKVSEARAICYYSPPMQFTIRTRKIANVQETSLTVLAQISMLNHANYLEVAAPPPVSKVKNE